jgi:formylglycine-generating enzyme required for sulfatase activity
MMRARRGSKGLGNNRTFVRTPLSSPFVPVACALLLALVATGTASEQAPASSPAQGYKETISGTVVSFEMVPVPGGSVTVGGTATKVEPFLIGRTEVTWDMYDLFAEGGDVRGNTSSDAATRPSHPYGAPDYGWGHAGYPAISVTRQAAEAFCAWLSAKTGKTYRLPTEAEWVRAAELAAGKESTAASREAITWHRGNATATTHPVGARKPDALGLFDLFGNAAEWVTTADNTRVTRGGSFRDPLENTGPAARAEQDPSWNERDPQLPKSRWWLSDGPFVGFRLVSTGK